MDHFKTFLAQLWQWPPTSSTVYGATIVIGFASYAVTGSSEAAGFIAGAVSFLCPQDAPAVNRAISDINREIATTPKV